MIYDIGNPKRLSRVARILERHAIRIQYSVFLGIWNSADASLALDAVVDRIHPRKDDVRAYRIPRRCHVHLYGRPSLSPDSILVEKGVDLLLLLQHRGPEWIADAWAANAKSSRLETHRQE